MTNPLLQDLAEVMRVSGNATPGEWAEPHLSDANISCNCPYVFAEGQQSMGSVCDIRYDKNNDHGEVLEVAKANGSLIALAINFLRAHHAAIEQNARDAERLNWLENQREAYGFENLHEGNRWILDGPFNTARQAIDAAMSQEKGRE